MMNKRADYEKRLWNAAKNPMSTFGQEWIKDHAHSQEELRRARDEARVQRDQGTPAGHLVYRITTQEYSAFAIALGTEGVNQGQLEKW